MTDRSSCEKTPTQTKTKYVHLRILISLNGQKKKDNYQRTRETLGRQHDLGETSPSCDNLIKTTTTRDTGGPQI